MSRKASAVRGDPTDDTGSPVLGQDDQGREEVSTSPNSGAEPGAGVQSTPTQPTPVSVQGSGSGKRKKSHSRKQTETYSLQTETYSLTTRQQKLTPKPRKTKARNAKGVKASDAKGTKSGLVPGAGRGRGAVSLLPDIKPGPESVQLPDTSESSDTEEEDEAYTQPTSHSLQESKPDQLALSPVIPPQGTSTPGDVTTLVTDTPAMVQDPSPVSNDAPPSSSTPVMQEGTAADPITVSAEVYEVPESELDEDNVSEDPLTALAHMTLETQTGSELPRQEDSFQPASWEVMGNPERILTLDPAMPLAQLVGRIRAHLSPVRGYASGGERVPPLDGDDLIALEGYVARIGWEDLPSLQPKQVGHMGVACLVRALQGTVIQLVQLEDNESDTSSVETMDLSQLWDRSERDPLGLTQGNPKQEEGEWTGHSSPEAMDQDEVMEHDAPLNEDSTRDTGSAFGQRTDSQSEDMDVAAPYSDSEGHSGQPMETQEVRYSRGNPEPTWDEGGNEMARRRRLYPKVWPYTIPVQQDIDTGWYQGEDMMDPNDVAPPARRIGLPNVDGSIGGDHRHALPPPCPTRRNFYYGRELCRRVTYDHAAKNTKGQYPHITEEERATRAVRQDTALQSDDHLKEQLNRSHYFPTPEDSPVNFSYRVASSTYAIPYHVVGPMTWEYPYHSGQAQEDLSDRLVPASLYWLKVTRPGYCSADAKPATATEAQAAFDSGRGFVDHVSDTDVNAHAIPVGQVGRGHQGAALFVCVQPECTVARGHEPLFATLEQWAAHWNSFHVAATPAFNCMV